MSKQLVGAAKHSWGLFLIAALGFAFLAILRPGTAEAVAPTFGIQSWKNGQTVLVLQFSQPVNNGLGGPLESSDFTVAGASAINIAAVSHTINSSQAVLTLAGPLNSAASDFTIACAGSNAVMNQPVPPASAEACPTTPVNVYGTPEDTAGPQVVGVSVNSATQVIVDFNETLAPGTAIAGNFTLTTAASGDNSAITGVTYFGLGVEVNASGAQIATGSGNTVAVTSSVTDLVGNAATPATVTLMPSIKISEVKLGSSLSSQDEFIELYNPGMSAFSMGSTASPNLRLHIWNGTTDTAVALTILSASIPSNGYYLIGSTLYSGSVPLDASYNGSIAQLVSNGAVYISLSATANVDVVDKLGWGSSTVNETASVTPDLVVGSSLERKADDLSSSSSMAVGGVHFFGGNSYDTGNNANDFVLISSPVIQNSTSSPEFAGSFGQQSQSGDTTAPTVVDTFPNAATVAANAVPVDLMTVGVDFSESMFPASISTTTVRVTRNSAPGTNLCATVTYNAFTTSAADTLCTITSLPLLAEPHTLTVTTGAMDNSNNPLAANYTFSFTPNASMTSASSAPPTVVGGYPIDGSFSVPPSVGFLSVNFSRSMNPATFTTSNITLTNTTTSTAQTLAADDFTARTIMFSNDSVDIDVSGITFAAGNAYRLTLGTGVTSSDAVPLAAAVNVAFTVASSIDVTGPLVIGSEPSAASTGVPVGNAAILVVTDDALVSTSVTSTSARLFVGSDQVPVTVTYNADFREIQLTASNVFSPNTTYTVKLSAAGSGAPIMNVSGIALQDNDGTANNTYEFTFTTGGADATAPAISYATATESNVYVTFTEPMNSSQITNVANWTLQSPTSTSVPLSALGGSLVAYDVVDMTATLSGVQLTEDNTFTVSLSGVADLSGNTINPSANSASGTVMGESSGAQSGPGASFSGNTWDNPAGFTTFAYVPQPSVWLSSPVVNVTTNIGVDVPITEQIRSGANNGKVTLTFPTGFDVANVVAMSGSPSNNDVNGPGSGAVAVSSVTTNASARTVDVAFTIATRCGSGNTDPCVTGEENDFLHFDLSGLVNPSVPRGFDTSGYTVDIKTKTGSTVLESLTSMPFYINAAGSNSLTVNLSAGSANAGTVTVYLASPMSGQVSATSTAFSSGSASASFTGLNTGNYMVWTDPQMTLDGTLFVGITKPMPVFVDGADSTTLTLTSAADLTTITVNVSGATGKNVDVFASGPTGFTVQEIESTVANQNVTLVVGDGRWFIGVGPHMEMSAGTSVIPPSPDYIVSSPVEAVVNGASVQETSGTANDGTVVFTLTSATLTLPVLVQNTSSLPIADAMVFANSVTGGFSTFAPAGINGMATLAIVPGSYRVGAFVFGAPPPPETSVVVEEDGDILVNGSNTPVAQVTIEIGLADTVISGQVTDGTNAIQGASVYAFCTADCDGSPNAFSNTDSNGNYTLYVNDGTYTVRAFLPGYGELAGQTVIVNGADQSNINFSAGSTTFRTISGTVCIQAGGGSSCVGGTPITNAFVSAQNGTNFNGTAVDASGAYTLRVPAGSGYTVEAFTPTGMVAQVTGVNTTSVDQTGVNLVQDTPNTVTINIKNAAGTLTSITDLFVELVNTTTNMRTNTYLASGSSTTISVPSGSYRVDAMTPMFRFTGSSIQSDNASTVVSSSVLTVDGTETIKLVVPTLRTITGTLSTASGAVADAWVELANSATHVGDSTDASGAFSIQVPDGTYQMTAYKSGVFVEPITLVVSASSTQNLTGTVTNRVISGTVTVAGSPATNGFVSAVRTGGGEIGTPVNPDGTYSFSVSDGTWTLTGVSYGYAFVTLSPITVSSSSPTSSGNTIALTQTVTLADPRTQSLTPSTGGVFDDDDLGVTVTAGAGAISSSTGTGSLSVQETNEGTDTGTTDVIGNSFEIAFVDSTGTEVADFNSTVTIDITLTIAELAAEGVDTLTEVMELGMSYRDSTGAWIGEATTITFLDADGDVVASPSENLSGVASVRFTVAVDHATVFTITAPADGLAPAAPTGVSATTSSAPIIVSWTAVTTNSDSSPITDLVGYEVYRDTSSGGSFSTQLNTSDITGTSYTDSTAVIGTTYFYKVTAADTGGQESAMSSAASGLRVTASGGVSGGGSGASTVTVVADSVTIAAPNGGGTLNGGSTTNITWSSTGSINNIVLSYSLNGGTTYTNIVSGTANDGTYSWTVPNTATSQARVKVVGRDAGGATLATDTSDSNFIIAVNANLPTESTPTTTTTTTTAPASTMNRTEAEATLPVSVSVDELVKVADDGNSATDYDSTVYYLGLDAKRHPFVNAQIFSTWYANFDAVKTIDASTLTAIPLGTPVLVRPGTMMVKIQSDVRTFAVEPGSYTIRHVADEATAVALYGANWNKRILDIEPTYWSRFTMGSTLSGNLHPAGSVLKDGSTTYYFDGSTKRAFASDAARKANFFQDKYIISGVTATDWKIKADGAAITGFEDALFSLQR